MPGKRKLKTDNDSADVKEMDSKDSMSDGSNNRVRRNIKKSANKNVFRKNESNSTDNNTDIPIITDNNKKGINYNDKKDSELKKDDINALGLDNPDLNNMDTEPGLIENNDQENEDLASADDNIANGFNTMPDIRVLAAEDRLTEDDQELDIAEDYKRASNDINEDKVDEQGIKPLVGYSDSRVTSKNKLENKADIAIPLPDSHGYVNNDFNNDNTTHKGNDVKSNNDNVNNYKSNDVKGYNKDAATWFDDEGHKDVNNEDACLHKKENRVSVGDLEELPDDDGQNKKVKTEE